MSVRAKFIVKSVTDFDTGTTIDTMKQVKLQAVGRNDGSPEDFWKYTPAGSIDITISNKSAAEQFKPGKAFYITFVAAN